jgi:uncharacterized protein YqjF (DUF2071 family)
MNTAPLQQWAAPTERVEPENRRDPTTGPSFSDSARRRMEGLAGEPLFLADWLDVTMLHYEVDPEQLQRLTPLPIDCFEGRAFATLVAFQMTNMRLRCFPRLTAVLFRPFTESRFLNLRTYVRGANEAGIQFLVEWLSNRACVGLGPVAYGLPYRAGRLDFMTRDRTVTLRAQPRGLAAGLDAELEIEPGRAECARGSLDEFLMERYTAFTIHGRRRRRFHIWHRPWMQARCRVKRMRAPLLGKTFPELAEARFVGAKYCAGVRDVWMSRPFRL